MAVRNEWANADVEAGRRGNPSQVAGVQKFGFVSTFEIAAGDDDASIIRLAKLPANAILTKLDLYCDALTGCTSVDAGLYKENGVVADVNIYAGAKDIAAGQAIGSPENMMADVALENLHKKAYELLGLTVATKTENAYDLALTFNTIGSGAGTVTVVGEYIVG